MPPRPRRRIVRAALLPALIAAAFLAPGPLIAQRTEPGRAPGAPLRGLAIAGLVLDAQTMEPLAGADVIVENVRGERVFRTMSGDEGRFLAVVEGPGLYSLRLVRLGYDSTTAVQVAVSPGQDLFVEIRANPAAVGLDPITVSAPRVVPFLVASGFYERQRRGLGSYLDRDDLERMRGLQPTQALIRIPGLYVQGNGRILMRGGAGSFSLTCSPTVYVDGMMLRDEKLDDLIPMMFIEAIEVYKGPATVPPQWRGISTCGVIVIWSRR